MTIVNERPGCSVFFSFSLYKIHGDISPFQIIKHFFWKITPHNSKGTRSPFCSFRPSFLFSRRAEAATPPAELCPPRFPRLYLATIQSALCAVSINTWKWLHVKLFSSHKENYPNFADITCFFFTLSLFYKA